MNCCSELNVFYSGQQNQEIEFSGSPAASGDGSPAAADVIETAVKEKNVRRVTFALIFVIAFSIAVIWFMNKKNTPAAANAAVSKQQLQIETALARLTGTRQKTVVSMDEMVKKFYEFSNFSQVRPSQLACNPFVRSFGSVAIATRPDNIPTADNTKLELKSILESKYGNCCMINDALLYKGDKIAGFEVMEIDSEFVVLKSGNSKIKLRFGGK